MAVLPDEVAATIAKAQIVPDEQEHHDPLIKRVFGKLAKLLAQAIETEEVRSEDNGEPTENKTTETHNNGTAYGYPPAYGVPANISVQLLYDAFKLLEKLLDEVSDDELSSEIKELKERIAQALGINAQEFVAPIDIFREMRLAVTVSLGTQPVVPATEAAECLRKAWDDFVQAVSQVEYALPVGKMFDVVFALRSAVEAALKALGAVCTVEELQETVVEPESNAASNRDAEQFEQAPETSQAAESEQTVVAEGQPNEPIMEAPDPSDSALAASSSQESAPAMLDDRFANIIQEAIAPIVDRIEELMQRIEAVENAVKVRRRVSSFVASNRKEESDDDLWRRWLKASESERRMLLREAQKLLAAPVPLDRD
jgi:hypothetical protein